MDSRIIAHRGASGYAPENTLDAFALAAEMSACAVELDVYLTADNRLAVHHDANVSRMTNGACAEYIEKLTLDELKKYSFCGSYADRYPDAALPELCEVYTLLRGAGMWVNTELQSSPEDPKRRELFVSLLLEAAEKCGMSDKVIYSAFDTENLKALKKADESVRTALLYRDSASIPEDMTPWDYAKSLGCSAIHPYYRRITDRDYCVSCHEAGLLVHPWTANTADDILSLLDLGADAVITNYPDILTK